MLTVQQLKKTAYKKLEESGCFKNVQAQLKTQVFQIVQNQNQSNKNKLGFKYQHPLLSKLLKYQLTSLCLDLIQQFLQSFKFEYTLNVFKKQINRSDRIKRQELVNKFKVEILNSGSQAVLLSLVTQLNKGEIKVIKQTKESKQTKLKEPLNKFQNKPESQKQKQKQKQKANIVQKDKQKVKQKQNKKIQQQQQIPKKESKKQQKKQSQVPKKKQPKTAADFLANLDKYQVQQKKPERSVSAPPVQIVKKQPPPETGVNKIRGSSNIKTNNIGSFYGLTANKTESSIKDPYAYDLKAQTQSAIIKDPYNYDIKPKGTVSQFGKTTANVFKKNKDEQIEQQLDEFQQSRDSNRSKKNPMFSSTQQALQSMGYDQSVDSIAIEEYDYYEAAKKKKR